MFTYISHNLEHNQNGIAISPLALFEGDNLSEQNIILFNEYKINIHLSIIVRLFLHYFKFTNMH